MFQDLPHSQGAVDDEVAEEGVECGESEAGTEDECVEAGNMCLSHF